MIEGAITFAVGLVYLAFALIVAFRVKDLAPLSVFPLGGAFIFLLTGWLQFMEAWK